eukprot:NODE_1451_length_1030_cov_0.803437.p1 type:complete len:230 gc:universal NODE_1451_length_1030_cov_0.803437:125-814(+)
MTTVKYGNGLICKMSKNATNARHVRIAEMKANTVRAVNITKAVDFFQQNSKNDLPKTDSSRDNTPNSKSPTNSTILTQSTPFSSQPNLQLSSSQVDSKYATDSTPQTSSTSIMIYISVALILSLLITSLFIYFRAKKKKRDRQRLDFNDKQDQFMNHELDTTSIVQSRSLPTRKSTAIFTETIYLPNHQFVDPSEINHPSILSDGNLSDMSQTPVSALVFDQTMKLDIY